MSPCTAQVSLFTEPLRATPRGSGGLSAAQLPLQLVSGQQTTHPLPPQFFLAPHPQLAAVQLGGGARHPQSV